MVRIAEAVRSLSCQLVASPFARAIHVEHAQTLSVRRAPLFATTGQRARTPSSSPASSAITRPVAASAGTVTDWASRKVSTASVIVTASRGERVLMTLVIWAQLAFRKAVWVG
jgi:hypothetical protein